jgi:hypothetical protein
VATLKDAERLLRALSSVDLNTLPRLRCTREFCQEWRAAAVFSDHPKQDELNGADDILHDAEVAHDYLERLRALAPKAAQDNDAGAGSVVPLEGVGAHGPVPVGSVPSTSGQQIDAARQATGGNPTTRPDRDGEPAPASPPDDEALINELREVAHEQSKGVLEFYFADPRSIAADRLAQLRAERDAAVAALAPKAAQDCSLSAHAKG